MSSRYNSQRLPPLRITRTDVGFNDKSGQALRVISMKRKRNSNSIEKKCLLKSIDFSKFYRKWLKIKKKKLSYVYMLKCSDGTYYTGVTSNLTQRMEKHVSGFYKDCYTYKRRPVQLVFYTEFTDIKIAIRREKQIKSWSKAKKEALIEGRYEDLPNLAKKLF